MSRIILTPSISTSRPDLAGIFFMCLVLLAYFDCRPVLALDKKDPKMAFVKGSCWGCHARGENAINGDKPLKGILFAKKYPEDGRLAAAIRAGFPNKGMPRFPKERLSDADLALIIKYIRSLTPPNASK